MNKLLIIFVAILGTSIGLTLARYPSKEEFIQRLTACQDTLSLAHKNFTSHALDYFARIINFHMTSVRFTLKRAHKLPGTSNGNETKPNTEALLIENELQDYEKNIPWLIRNPAPSETLKAGGLYLSHVLASINSTTSPSPDELKEQVKAIMIQERAVGNATSAAEQEAEKEKLAVMYQELAEGIHDDRLPTLVKMFTLEADARRLIREFYNAGKEKEMMKFADALALFLERSDEIAPILPIRDQESYDRFLAAVPKHYAAFGPLNGMVFIESVEGVKI